MREIQCLLMVCEWLADYHSSVQAAGESHKLWSAELAVLVGKISNNGKLRQQPVAGQASDLCFP